MDGVSFKQRVILFVTLCGFLCFLQSSILVRKIFFPESIRIQKVQNILQYQSNIKTHHHQIIGETLQHQRVDETLQHQRVDETHQERRIEVTPQHQSVGDFIQGQVMGVTVHERGIKTTQINREGESIQNKNMGRFLQDQGIGETLQEQNFAPQQVLLEPKERGVGETQQYESTRKSVHEQSTAQTTQQHNPHDYVQHRSGQETLHHQNVLYLLRQQNIGQTLQNQNSSDTLQPQTSQEKRIVSEGSSMVSHKYLGKENLYHSNILTEKAVNRFLQYKHYAKRFRRVTQVDCRALFNQDQTEIKRADKIPIRTVDIERYEKMTGNCEKFVESRGYITDYLTEEEKNFPIAFSILMYKNVEQTERLLRAIYRPQNLYCIHVDAKTSDKIFEAMSDIANCFDNVFMPKRRISVVWGKMSVLQPELLCMKELWGRSKTWKYFINLTGQEFPLRTNYELVKILTVYNGSNDVEATRERNQKRWKNAPKPPHRIIPTKGAVHVAVSRGFVNYVLHDKRAHDLLAWTNLTKVPDETFFSTLNHNPHLGVPGSYKGYPETTRMRVKTKPYLARFKNRGRYIYNWECDGRRVRGMCIFGHGDLARLAKRKELFANKFYLDYQPFVFGCLEELNFNLTRDEYLGRRNFSPRWYSQLGFIAKKVG